MALGSEKVRTYSHHFLAEARDSLRCLSGFVGVGLPRRGKLQLLDVSKDFFFAGPALHVKPDHLVGALGWFSASPQRDQVGGNECTIDLYGYSFYGVA